MFAIWAKIFHLKNLNYMYDNMIDVMLNLDCFSLSAKTGIAL